MDGVKLDLEQSNLSTASSYLFIFAEFERFSIAWWNLKIS